MSLASSPLLPPPPAHQRRVSDGTLAGKVHGVFIQRMMTGVYALGQRLPTEHDLAREFGVSRPVLRQAMDRLRAEGLIRSRQGSGSVVVERPDQASLGLPPAGTMTDVQRCFEFRLAIEPQAAAHAALRRSADDLAHLSGALASLGEATRHHLHREDADMAFHLAVATASGNAYFRSALNGLADHIATGMKLHGLSVAGPRSALEEVYDEHHAIAAAIAAGDAAGACSAMQTHLRTSHDRLFAGAQLDQDHP